MSLSIERRTEEGRDVEYTLIPGHDAVTKDVLFKRLEGVVQVVDIEQYARKFTHFEYAPVAFQGRVGRTENGEGVIGDVEILICQDRFVLDGEDYSDVIPVIVRHEMEEIWVQARGGMPQTTAPEAGINSEHMPHYSALDEQYRYARALGKADRTLEYLIRYAKKAPEYFEQYRVHFDKVGIDLDAVASSTMNNAIEENLAAYRRTGPGSVPVSISTFLVNNI